MSNAIKWPGFLVDRMLEHARATPEVEVCGLLGAKDGIPTSLYPIPNIADIPATAFLMEPRAQIDAMRAMREAGESLFAIYHSHPGSSAVPSETDLRLAAYPGVLYLIISLANERKPEIWTYHYDGKQFSNAELCLQ